MLFAERVRVAPRTNPFLILTTRLPRPGQNIHLKFLPPVRLLIIAEREARCLSHSALSNFGVLMDILAGIFYFFFRAPGPFV